MQTINIKRYDNTWPEEFKRIKSSLFPRIDGLIEDIVHVGSTSVPGLPAEPIIDMNIVVGSYDVFPELAERLGALGYIEENGCGADGRGRFRKDSGGPVTHYLGVCLKDSDELFRQTAFRDYLIEHPSRAGEYGILKSYLALKFPFDIDSYTAGKQGFIERAVEEAMGEMP